MLLKWNTLFRYHSCQTHSQHLYSKAVSPLRSLASITGKEHNNAVFGWSSRLVWAAASADRLGSVVIAGLSWSPGFGFLHRCLDGSTVFLSWCLESDQTTAAADGILSSSHHMLYLHLAFKWLHFHWFQWACCKMQPGAPQTVFFAALGLAAAAAGKILAVISSAGKIPEQIKLSIMCLATFTYLYLPVFWLCI